MSDKVSSVTNGLKEAAGVVFKEVNSQVFGNTAETQKRQEETEKLQKKAEENNRSIEEQAKLESVRKQLHAQVTAPRPSEQQPERAEQEDQVGTNETNQKLGGMGNNSQQSGLSPLAQPNMRHGERLKIRE